MKEITVDPNLVACCGLYCGACPAYLKEKCPGCRENKKAGWCKVRRCCQSGHLKSCADCMKMENVSACKTYNNWISKLVGMLFRSNRAACVSTIRRLGYEGFAQEMALRKKHSLPR